MRNKRQEIWDRIALLTLFKEVNRRATISGRLQLQKLTFLMELEGQEVGIKSAHFRFFRYTMGPYSADLAQDSDFLENLGFIVKSSHRLTKRADFLLEYVSDAIVASQTAQTAFQIIKDISAKYGKRSGQSLMGMVYKMRVPVYEFGGEQMEVEDIPMFADILDPANEASLAEPDQPLEDLLTDLEEEFAIPPEDLDPASPSFKRTIRSAMARLELPSTVS